MRKSINAKSRPVSGKEFLKQRDIHDDPVITKNKRGHFVRLTTLLNAYRRTW